METIITILAPALTLLIGALVAWALKKAGLSPENTVIAVEAVKKGVEHAETLAKLNKNKMPGPAKLKSALETIDRISATNPEVAEYLRKHATTLIERMLRSDITDKEMTPSASA